MSEKCGATCRDGSECEAYPVTGGDRCRMHGGKGSGAPDKNQNARSHGLHSTPEYLLEDLDDSHLDTYHATFEALCTRYQEIHGSDPDFAAKKRLSRVAVEMVKEDLADEYLKQNASEHILVEDETIGYSEDDTPQEVTQANKLLPELTALKRETRLALKDMGLLNDPESQKADEMGQVRQLWAEDIRN